jgi:hypothetical protein
VVGLRHGWSGDLIETTASAIISLPFTIYLFAAGRCTYAESRGRSGIKALLLSGWTVAVLTAYRFLLFFTTFYAT